MRRALLSRFESTDLGTYGLLTSEGFKCYMTERPWLDNQKQVSCIPVGTYFCHWKRSPKFGMCYEVTGVPDRGSILIHPGNYYWNSHGCLLPATRLGYIQGKKAGIASRPAVLRLNAFFNTDTFLLEIQNAYNSSSPTF